MKSITNKKIDKYIPLSVPTLGGNELQYVKECIETEWVSSAGKFVELFEKEVANFTGSNHAIACVNGTSAIQVSLRLAGVCANDEVIVPTLTFIAPVNAITYNNAIPIFMDSDEYYNIHSDKTCEFIENETIFKKGFTYNKKTDRKISAIIPVHVWGNACNLVRLSILCNERNISIIEDASESLGTYYHNEIFKNKHTGTIGKIGCISFNGNKIITSGGGGMILTDEEELYLKGKYLTTQAKNDSLKYIHDEIGYNFRLTNIQAALGLAQMEQLPKFLTKKKKINQYYKKLVNKIPEMEISTSPNYSTNNNWINLIQIANSTDITNVELLINKLEKRGIQTRPVWRQNHLQLPFKNCQNYEIENANKLVNNSLCLPSSTNLKYEDISRIVTSLHE